MSLAPVPIGIQHDTIRIPFPPPESELQPTESLQADYSSGAVSSEGATGFSTFAKGLARRCCKDVKANRERLLDR